MSNTSARPSGGDAPRVGDRVQIRTEAEILATLDERGELDALPFMPEMLPFCGQELTVVKVAHKVCDTITAQGLRKMERAVHLTAARCDGSAHGGCQNGCLIYWKEDWLKRPGEPAAESPVDAATPPRVTLPMLTQLTRKAPAPDGTELFSCQATELNRATPERQSFLDLKQYALDFKTGNASIYRIVRSFVIGLFNRFQLKSRTALPAALRFRRGLRWRFLEGQAQGRTPTVDLDLQPGERVRVKSREEIVQTLSPTLQNRGMGFDEEMSRFCGREATVERRVQQVIDEKTSRMAYMKTPSVVLEGTFCEGAYNSNCPRSWICFWREIWLDRVEPTKAD